MNNNITISEKIIETELNITAMKLKLNFLKCTSVQRTNI